MEKPISRGGRIRGSGAGRFERLSSTMPPESTERRGCPAGCTNTPPSRPGPSCGPCAGLVRRRPLPMPSKPSNATRKRPADGARASRERHGNAPPGILRAVRRQCRGRRPGAHPWRERQPLARPPVMGGPSMGRGGGGRRWKRRRGGIRPAWGNVGGPWPGRHRRERFRQKHPGRVATIGGRWPAGRVIAGEDLAVGCPEAECRHAPPSRAPLRCVPPRRGMDARGRPSMRSRGLPAGFAAANAGGAVNRLCRTRRGQRFPTSPPLFPPP